MSATLEVICNFSIEVNGNTITGKQGAATAASTTAFEVTVDGKTHYSPEQLATATERTLWDDDSNFPVNFDYLFFWSDQDCYIQFVGSATNYAQKIKAKIPYILGYDDFLAAASTTDISAEPTTEDVDHIRIGNYSGNTMNYVFFLVD